MFGTAGNTLIAQLWGVSKKGGVCDWVGVAWLALILYTRQPHVSSCLCVLFPQAAFRQGARTEWNLLSGAADRGDDSNFIMSYYYTQTWPLPNNRVQKPEWQEDITKTFEWVTYPQWLLWWAHRNPSQCLNACCSINLAYLENHLIITVEMLFSCDKKKKKILRDFQVKVKYIKQN